MMKDTRTARRAVGSRIPPPYDSSFDEMAEEQKNQGDPEAVARKMTDPLIEAMRKELEKIDVTAFKK
jgi:hypothetical protein